MASVARQPVPRPQDRYWTSTSPHTGTDIRYTPREAVPGRQLVEQEGLYDGMKSPARF